MTRVDFYILKNPAADSAPHMACRLAEKAYSLKHRIYIHTADAQQTEYLDNLLWTFRDGSFLPHQKHTTTKATECPILIGHEAELETKTDYHSQVLINLDHDVPLFFSRFERVAEIVPASEAGRNSARERYKFYRERGYELNSHELS